MKNLYVYENAAAGLCETRYAVIDLSKVVWMARRNDGTWWLTLQGGGHSLHLDLLAGEDINRAWVAFAGKFDPQKDR